MQEAVASVITIGDELLIGQTVDTNSAFIAQELNKIGVWVHRRVAVSDNREAILSTLEAEQREAAIVIITGGLGPTADDITKPALCEYFHTELVRDEGATVNVRAIFQKLGRPLTERNLSQGLVPGNCVVLQNGRGTAPGMWWDQRSASEAGGTPWAVVSLPGVPHEMKGLMTDAAIPKIKASFVLPVIVHRTLLTAGQGESFIADALSTFESELPSRVKLAYLPSYGMVRLRLTGRGQERAAIEAEVEGQFHQLKTLVKEWMVADEDITIYQAVVQLLKQRGKTVSTAESCTGGTLARLITSVPGSSAVYNGTVVSYANEVKQNLLGVTAETLQQHGAVSEQTVTQMATVVCGLMNTDYAVATSGIMGPDGGTPAKPVGTVWIAVADKEGTTEVKSFHFRFDRARNTELAAYAAFNLLRKFILGRSGA